MSGVPKVDYPNYPSHEYLSSISRDELAWLFCEKTILYGGTPNFSTTEQILNMVMTFVHTPWSHYNTITKPCAHFLLSLTKDLSINFPSHMIISILDCYQDTATRDKFIFPSAITCILTHIHVTIPPSPLFHVMGTMSKESIRRIAEWMTTKQPHVETMDVTLPLDPPLHMPFLPLLGQISLSLTSWISFSTRVLILVIVLTICVMGCVRWTL